ncbi:hypothetical protein B0H14DRAFT_1664483 [Mycena olivaceomarginata]|nr:hypothetical protein B0H14DRAFT_1664483 [Mycena olivaceomarginata]
MPASHQCWMTAFQRVKSIATSYCRRKRGFPLYDPTPQQSLPQEYQIHGVAIGDVGSISPEGSFDFFFNIYLPANHPINNDQVPEMFCPLPCYESQEVYEKLYGAGDHVSTSTMERLDTNINFPGGDFISTVMFLKELCWFYRMVTLCKLRNLETGADICSHTCGELVQIYQWSQGTWT